MYFKKSAPIALIVTALALSSCAVVPVTTFEDTENVARQAASLAALSAGINAGLRMSTNDAARSLDPANPSIAGRTPAQVRALAAADGRFPSSGFMSDMYGLPGLSTYIVIGPDSGGYHLVDQYTYTDYDFSMDYIRYQYYVATGDTTWKIFSGPGTGEFRYTLWEEVYRDGTRLARTLGATSSDAAGTGPKYDLGSLPTPRTGLASYRFTGEPTDVTAPATGATATYSSRSTFLRRKPDSAGQDPGRGIEYYTEYNASGTITARSLSYLIEKQGRSKTADFVNTTTWAEFRRNATGLAFLDSRTISLTESGNNASSWQTRIIDTIIDPTPSNGFVYESIDATWYAGPASVTMDSSYSSAAQRFITQLNPVAGGYQGFLYQKWDAPTFNKWRIDIANRVMTQTWVESSAAPATSPRGLNQATIDLAQLPRLKLDTIPGASGSFDGNFAGGEFWGTYRLNGKEAYVEVTAQGVLVTTGSTTTFHSFRDLGL